MRCACIDVGSNTTRLLVAETVPGGIREVRNERAFTLIGKGLAEGDRIPAEKLAETAAVVAEQVELAHALGAERVRAVATAAIRRASNAVELVEAVEERAGVPLDVLAGEEEARLAFRGAARALGGHGGGTLTVVDVGGGSTEIAVGQERGRISSAASFAVGSSMLADRHFASNPPAPEELDAARAEAREALSDFNPRPTDRAVAVGGSASSLQHLAGPELGPGEIARAMGVLASAPAAELAQRYGLDPARIRLLPAGLVILAELAASLGQPLRICKGGLREGVILEMMGIPR